MDRLNTELKNKAVSLGLCAQWTGEWTEKDKDELCEMYKRGLDFCIQHDYPSKDYMKEHFDGVMQKHGVYVDESVNFRSGNGVFVLNGDTHGEITVEGYDAATIHVRHTSFVRIIVKDKAVAFVKTYDGATARVVQQGKAKAYLYARGGNYSTEGDVRIRK